PSSCEPAAPPYISTLSLHDALPMFQEASGARVVALDEDWKMIEEAGSRPGRGGGPSPRVPKRDMVVRDGDAITLGATTVKLYHQDRKSTRLNSSHVSISYAVCCLKI